MLKRMTEIADHDEAKLTFSYGGTCNCVGLSKLAKPSWNALYAGEMGSMFFKKSTDSNPRTSAKAILSEFKICYFVFRNPAIIRRNL